MISVRELRKHYRVHKRPPGLKAAAVALFRRNYTTVPAVDGISFDITRGEAVGFLGPNGAGKTTTLKILSGLLHPTSGTVLVDGHEPRRREDAFLKKIMLVLGQKQQLLWDLPPAETFDLNAAIYEVPRPEYRAILSELVELLGIGDLIDKPARQLSLGERMKCELVATLIHRPRVLFMDEPTIGLDVSMQVTIRAFIKSYIEKHGATLLLTSHYMDDVAALCPRILVIDRGRLSYDGSLARLSERIRPEKRIVFRFVRPVERERLEPLGTVVSHDEAEAVLAVSRDAVNEAVARALATLPIQDLTVENPPLEEVMSELFSRGQSDETRDQATK